MVERIRPHASGNGRSAEQEKFAKATEECACTNFRKASRAVTQYFDDVLQPSGLRSTQLVVLLEVAVAGSATVPRLARRLVMDPSTVTRNLKPLVKQGWLECVPSNRKQVFRLTGEGRSVLERAVPLWERAQTGFVGKIGEERWRSLLDALSAAVSVARSAHHA